MDRLRHQGFEQQQVIHKAHLAPDSDIHKYEKLS
jgi:hypothetical protein